jgi:hypothetical protein
VHPKIFGEKLKTEPPQGITRKQSVKHSVFLHIFLGVLPYYSRIPPKIIGGKRMTIFLLELKELIIFQINLEGHIHSSHSISIKHSIVKVLVCRGPGAGVLSPNII